jgi:hypothetical protein
MPALQGNAAICFLDFVRHRTSPLAAQAEAYATETSLCVRGVAGFVFADLVAEVVVDGS